jgi:hypothetical protein
MLFGINTSLVLPQWQISPSIWQDAARPLKVEEYKTFPSIQ